MSATEAPFPARAPLRPDKRALRWLGALLPRGLLARTLLIILLPLVVLQGVALQLFYGGHLDVISRRLSAGVAGDVSFIAHLWRTRPRPGRISCARVPGGWASPSTWNGRPARHAAGPPGLDAAAAAGAGPRRGAARAHGLPLRRRLAVDPQSIVIRVQVPSGVLSVEVPRKRLFSTTLYVFVLWLVGSAVLLSAIAVLFMKNQVRAIRRLSAAAEDFGMGREIGAIKPEGAREVRQAAQAFNAMQERILRFVNQRTEMLAGISHDLRTPLTRMRLELAMLPADPAPRPRSPPSPRTSRRWSAWWRATSPSPAAKGWRRRARPTSPPCWARWPTRPGAAAPPSS
jgi:two-component system osmolarity sensor histidine kinase EnvZ